MLATAIVAATVGLFVVEAVPLHPPIDDAFISFRYARNLVEGAGLVYNLGEYVEGFTNLLWTLLVAAGIALGFDAVVVSQWLEIIAGSAVLVATFAYARTIMHYRRPWLAALTAVLVIAMPSFGYWTTAGLGEPLFVLLVTATLVSEATGRLGWMTALAFAATMMRPEGGLTAAIVFGFHWWRARDRGWPTLRYPLTYALGLAALTAFRLAYYGSPLPNTFYAKVGGIPIEAGVQYLRRFLLEGSWPLVLLAIPALTHDPRTRPAGALIVGTGAYAVIVGGDVFPFGRFLVPALPVLSGLAVYGASLLYNRRAWLGVVGAFGGVAALACALFGGVTQFRLDALWAPSQWPRNVTLSKHWQINQKLLRGGMAGARRMSTIAAMRGSPPLVASGAIGALGYYSRVPILDIFGLVDAVIARDRRPPPPGALLMPGHQRSNPEYILERNPDIILFPKDLPPHSHPASMDLVARPEFHHRYAWDPSVPGYRRRPDGVPLPKSPVPSP